MNKNPDCLACEHYGPPHWNAVLKAWLHQIPSAGPGGRSDKVLKCPASVIDGIWKHGKRLDQ